MIKAVVFDLDNTLVDFMSMKRRAIDAAIDAMVDAGLELQPQEIHDRIDAIYKERGIEYQQVFDDLIYNIFQKIDHRVLASGKPYAHVTATLMELIRRGIKLAVLTDAPSREAWLRLCYINFHHFFDVAVTFDDTGERKPSEKPFRMALNKLGVKPEEALMVGDWPERDVVGAKAVGMKTAFARYGDTFGTKEHDADYELKDISDLLKIVI
jgi:putative hydrolase of the HAD superfamily